MDQPAGSGHLVRGHRGQWFRYWLLDRLVIIMHQDPSPGGIDLVDTPGAASIYGLFMPKVKFSYFIDQWRHRL